ncbi:GGDEF domain-containing protein, partial [Escherichia coli]|nr:GGDEF domain-containing protein [Escherichia coli]
SAQIREILINESAWEEMTCLFAPSLGDVDLYYPGASLGIVEVDPETTDADSALHAADIAMYQEKKHKQKTPFVAHPALHS